LRLLFCRLRIHKAHLSRLASNQLGGPASELIAQCKCQTRYKVPQTGQATVQSRNYLWSTSANLKSLKSKMLNRIFILSPAFCGGKRGQMLMSEHSAFPLAMELRNNGASLGAIFTFMSGLYFRGKLAYSQAFAQPPAGLPGTLVVTPGRGLLPPEEMFTIQQLREIAEVEVHEQNPKYRESLELDAQELAKSISEGCELVLLGSVATSKYTSVLADVFSDRLCFPIDFVGRGDMSRGGLMLRCVENGEELRYVELSGSSRHGPRPPRLPPKSR